MNMEKILFTPDECRAILRISKSGMYSLLHEKKIESIRINRKFLISKMSLEKFIGMAIDS